MLETRTVVGIVGSALVHLAGAEAAADLFELDYERLPGPICSCGYSDPVVLSTPLLFVEASRPPPVQAAIPAVVDGSGRPCPSEAPLERLAAPRPLDPQARRALRKAAPERPSACARISAGGQVERAYPTRGKATGNEAALLDVLRSVRFEAARRDGRPVAAWHRVTAQAEPRS